MNKSKLILISILIFCISLFATLCNAQLLNTDIFIADLNITSSQVSINNFKNISNHPGYDNQPCIDLKNNCIYYTSLSDDGTTNFMKYNLINKATEPFINSTASLYSATITPDAKYISCIYTPDTNTQHLVKYPTNSSEPVVLIDHLVIGYHAWINNYTLLLFVLGKENTLHYYDLDLKKDIVLSKNIGRSLHKIPGKNACSYVQYVSEKERNLMMLDFTTMQSSVLIKLFDEHEDVTWTSDGILFSNDGQNLYYVNPFVSKDWLKVEINQQGLNLEGITRMQIDPKKKFLVLVASERK